MSTAEQYAIDVLKPENSRKTGRLIKLAAQRFLNDLQRDDIYFDEVEANRCINFGENHCKLWEDAWRGKPVEFTPWMCFVFQQVHGWIRKSDGLRRVKSVYVQVAKKNAKSTIAGVMANFHLFADDRVQTPKVFVGANNEDQAKICVNITGKIIEQSEDLYDLVQDKTVDLFRYKENIINIVHNERDGFIKALSKEGSDNKSKQAGGKHGLNPSMGIIDEFAMSADDNLLNTLESAQAARKEPLIFCITTSGFNMQGPCFQKLRKSGIGILEGTLTDDSYLPFIFEIDNPIDDEGKQLPITVDWLLANEDIWQQANPSLDVSVSRDFLRSRLMKAKNEGGTKEVDVMTLNFNRWVDSPEVFIPSDVWSRNSHGITEDDLIGEICYGGIELISGKVLNAFCLIFPEIKGKTVIKPLFWMPESAIKNNPEKFDGYGDWIDDGLILTTSGNVVDNEFVFNHLFEEIGKYQVHSVAYATNMENHDIIQALVKNGIECNPISQGYSGISTPTGIWEDMFTSGTMEHFNNPVLAWMNSNCLILRKGTEIRLERSGSKISGITAGINALAQWKTIEANGDFQDFTFSTL